MTVAYNLESLCSARSLSTESTLKLEPGPQYPPVTKEPGFLQQMYNPRSQRGYHPVLRERRRF